MDRETSDRLEHRLDRIEQTLVKNTESLVYHIKRTDELQDLVSMTSKHVLMVQGVFKAVLGLAAITAAVGGVLAALY